MKKNYQSLSFKKLLKMLRKKPKEASVALRQHPEYATALWEGGPKWISGSTALHWAAHDGHLAIAELLLDLGADINAHEANWWSRPIDWAADSGQYKMVRLLLEKGAGLGGDKWSNCTPLHCVAQGGSTNGKENRKSYRKTAEELIKWGADVNAIAMYGGQPPGVTPLDDAQRLGNNVVEKVLLANGGKAANALVGN